MSRDRSVTRIVDNALDHQMRALAVWDPAQWLDLALLMLISHSVAHSLRDGNGRTWRALYACMVGESRVDQSRLRFAPTDA